MSSLRGLTSRVGSLTLIVVLTAAFAAAQQTRGALRGLITDELGAAIVGANVTLTDASGVQKKTTTNGEGIYSFAGLAPGKYTVQASAPGFAPSENKQVDVTTARQNVDLTLRVTIEEKVTVSEPTVSTEATNNANQTVIAGKIWMHYLTTLTNWQRHSRHSLDHRLDPTAVRSLSTVSLAETCHRKMPSARFVLTRIHSLPKTISRQHESTF